MNKIVITSEEEYAYTVKKGFEPLLDGRFEMEHRLRRYIMRQRFGRGNHQANNTKFYRFMWEHKTHVCEECGRPLQMFSPSFISHILSRGAHPDKAYDPRNINILCTACHNRYENGDRQNMKIYPGVEKTIEILKNEYNNN